MSPFSDSGLRPVAVVFIELLLLIVHTADIHICIMADDERSDYAVIGSLTSVYRTTFSITQSAGELLNSDMYTRLPCKYGYQALLYKHNAVQQRIQQHR